jgi:hypothetical protein
MDTVHSTTKIKKSAKVIKYQNELREELAKTKSLMAKIDDQIAIYRAEIEELRTAANNNSESPQVITFKLQHIAVELRLMREERDECVSKINSIEKEVADVLYLNEILHSDVNPYEVVEMITPNKWVVRELDATLKPEARKNIQESFCPGGFAGHVDNDYQEWDIRVNEKNPLITVYRGKKNKYFKISGMPMSMTLAPIKIYDFNF